MAISRKVRSLGARALNAAVVTLMVAGLVTTVSACQAILEGRAEAVSPVWAWLGALQCPFIVFQLARAAVAVVRGAPAAVSAGDFRLLLILFVAVWAIVLFWGQPFHPTRAYMALGLWIGLFSLLLTLRTRLLAVIPGKPLHVTDLVLTNLCLVVLGGEIALRTVGTLFPSPFLARNRDTAEDLLAKNRIAPGTVRFGFPTNSRGHYDREFSPRPREGKLIASIGDSFSASSVPLPYHFTKVLEDRLRDTAVYNLGVPAIGPPEYHYLLVHEALPLEPDLVLVNIFVGNDIPEARGQSWPHLRSWFERDNVLICTVPGRVISVLQEDLPAGSPALIETREELERVMPWILDPTLDQPGFSEEAFMRIEIGRATQVFAPDNSYEPLFHWLTEMRNAAGEIPLVVMLIPDEYQAEEDLWEAVRARLPGRNPERFKHQRVIGAWLREQGIPCVDILPRIRVAEPLADGRRHLYRLRNTHLNVQGNEIAGLALVDFLTERFGFERQPVKGR